MRHLLFLGVLLFSSTASAQGHEVQHEDYLEALEDAREVMMELADAVERRETLQAKISAGILEKEGHSLVEVEELSTRERDRFHAEQDAKRRELEELRAKRDAAEREALEIGAEIVVIQRTKFPDIRPTWPNWWDWDVVEEILNEMVEKGEL